MQVARFFLLLSFAATLGACSSKSSSESAGTGTADPSAATDTTKGLRADSAETSRKLPTNVPATEYAAPPHKVDTAAVNK